jgi:Putative Flp pilus-assembly TadE/G-like
MGYLRNENGNVLVLTAIGLLMLLSVCGLVIDGGLLYLEKSRLEKTANAAALSGAQELTNTESEVRRVAGEILSSHNASGTLESITVKLKESVMLQLKKEVKLTFSSIFGMDTATVSARAGATLGVMGRAVGVAPLGVDESTTLTLYQPYQLKVGSGDSATGNFGILALGGTGARTYEENLRLGYDKEIKIGDIIDTQTGNIADKTRSAVEEKITACPENPRNIHDRDCARVILVPIYKAYQVDSNQVKQVMITGFAYFYITDPMDMKTTSVTGIFIERTGPGFTESGAKNYGAYAIRLTE